MVGYNTLSAVVRYIPGTGRCKVATEISIMLGPVMVASRTTGGRYTQLQALQEFHKNPQLFAKGESYAAAMQLVA